MCMEHPKGNIFRCKVIYLACGRAVPFDKYFRDLYNLPKGIGELRKTAVCFQTIETDESIAFIFNRSFGKNRRASCKVFMFNAVPCIKLGPGFWDNIIGGVKKVFYAKVLDDRIILLSDNKEKIPDGVDVPTCGTIDNCLLLLDRLELGSDIDEYYFTFDDGVFKFVPVIYPGEVSLVAHGNGMYIPIDGFYDRIKKDLEGDKTLLSILFNDKDRRLEFMK